MSTSSNYTNYYAFRPINNELRTLRSQINTIQATIDAQEISYNTLTIDTSFNMTGDAVFTGAVEISNNNGLIVTTGANIDDGTLLVSSLTQTYLSSAPTSDANIIKVSAGAQHSAILFDDGNCFLMGNNQYGQLGNGTTVDSSFAVALDLEGNITNVDCGFYHTAIVMDGKLYTFGQNNYGQLGIGDTTDRSSPVLIDISDVNTSSGILDIACGGNHTAILYKNTSNVNKVLTMGLNTAGELGQNVTTIRVTSPSYVKTSSGTDLSDVLYVSCGFNHTAMIVDNGTATTLYTCGDGTNGQTGQGQGVTDDFTNYIYAKKVDELGDLLNMTDVDCGGYTTYVRVGDNSFKSVGQNNYGQLVRTTSPATKTSIFADIDNIAGEVPASSINITAGSYHVGLYGDDIVYLVGRNNYGQLGTTASESGTNTIDTDFNSLYVACGGLHTLLQTSLTRVQGVGYNVFGQLGNGSITSTDSLVFTSGVTFDASNTVQVGGDLIVTGNLEIDGGNLRVKLDGEDSYTNVVTLLRQLSDQVTTLQATVDAL